MAPVYDLRTLFGYPGGPTPRWLLVVRAPDLVGLAFDHFEAHIQTLAANVGSTDGEEASTQFVRGVVRAADGVIPLIHMASLIEAITRRAQPGKPPREH
jgi:chemotaxis signal transduction protein